jgi:AraC family transcriptional regulator of arabinose operon
VVKNIQNPAVWDLSESKPPPAGATLAGHFRRGREYACQRRHGSKDWLLVFTKRGAGVFIVDGKAVDAIRGRCILLPPGTPHQYRSVSDVWDFYWAHFLPHEDWRPWMEGLFKMPRVDLASLGLERRMEAAFKRLLADQDLEGPVARDLVESALAEILLLILREGGWERQGPPDARFDQVLAILSQDLGQKLPLERLASGMGLSVSGFSHWFRGKAGMAPMHYRLRLRLRRGAELLSRTDASFTEIASELGFNTLFHFSAQFKAWYGMSPRAWRRKREGAGG